MTSICSSTASRVLLVHLSDIHFSESTDAILKRTNDICAAIQPLLPLATRVLIAVTGDIAQSGQVAEYMIAKSFINDIAT